MAIECTMGPALSSGVCTLHPTESGHGVVALHVEKMLSSWPPAPPVKQELEIYYDPTDFLSSLTKGGKCPFGFGSK